MSPPAGRSADIAIVGGGIVGTATATFLARAGARVTLYERSAIAAGASGRKPNWRPRLPGNRSYARCLIQLSRLVAWLFSKETSRPKGVW